MKVIFGDRSLIYQVVSASFKSLGFRPTIAELGVLRGDNAMNLKKILDPSHMFLIDAWSSSAFEHYISTNGSRYWVDNVSAFDQYYHGSVLDPLTFDRIYSLALGKFEADHSVTIYRASTEVAFNEINSTNPNTKLDFVYVDANHEFEKVLDDLMLYSQLLSHDGLIQLNDCCHSPAGIRQNLGVLEAVVKFCKIKQFSPILMTNSDWTDVLLVPERSRHTDIVDQIINTNDISYVEIPPQLIGASTVRYGKRANLSFR
jgi:hypothetical protein